MQSVQGASSLNVAVLQHQLRTQYFGVGERLLYLPVVESTNTFAMRLAQERPEEGVVVLTDSQTAGKGRLGRRWVDVSGCNVLSSTVLRPLFPPHFLVMIASLAAVDAIAETCGVVATIKWPNDVLVHERKVAGILIETSHDIEGRMVAILGIGINVNGHIQNSEAPLSATAITLEEACGHVVSRETVIAHLLAHIETNYLALQQESTSEGYTVFSETLSAGEPISRRLRERWRGKLATLGRTVEVRQGSTIISGFAEGVNDNGELLLRSHSGACVTITWGDVGHPTG